MRNILTVTFWAALSPWIVRKGLVEAAFSGDAWVPESKLLMGICAPPVICSCCTSDWWWCWWWCCCCTNWYRRAWCCSCSNKMGGGGIIKGIIKNNSCSLGSCLSKSSASATLNLIPANLGYTNEAPQVCGKGKEVPIKPPKISSSCSAKPAGSSHVSIKRSLSENIKPCFYHSTKATQLAIRIVKPVTYGIHEYWKAEWRQLMRYFQKSFVLESQWYQEFV